MHLGCSVGGDDRLIPMRHPWNTAPSNDAAPSRSSFVCRYTSDVTLLAWAGYIRRAKRIAGVVAALALVACTTGSGLRNSQTGLPNRQVPNVLVLMPDAPSAQEVLQGLRDELDGTYNLVVRLTDNPDPAAIRQEMLPVRPQAVVLMNNPTVRVFRRYQQTFPQATKVPVIVLLTSFLKEAARGIENYTGVAYEVPLVTSLVNLRDLLAQPVQRVGVIHRASFRHFLDDQASLASREGFVLVRRPVEEGDVTGLRRALDQLRDDDEVDVIWV